MDRRALLAIALCLLIWALWDYYYLSKHRKVEDKKEAAKVEEKVQPDKEKFPEGLKTRPLKKPKPAQMASEKISDISGELVTLEFNSNGAGLAKTYLNKYKEELEPDSPKIELFKRDIYKDEEEEPLALEITFDPAGSNIQIPERQPYTLVSSTEKEIKYTYRQSGVFEVTKTFRKEKDPYSLRMIVEVKNLGNTPIEEQLGIILNKFGYKSAKKRGMLGYYERGAMEYNYLMDGKVQRYAPDKVTEVITDVGNIDWMTLGDKYFFVAVIPVETGRKKIVLSEDTVGQTFDNGQKKIELLQQVLYYPQASIEPGKKKTYEILNYVGPKKLKLLTIDGVNIEKAVNFRFFGTFAVWLLKLMNLFNKVVHNYGVSIILLTIFIKILFFPLTQKSFKSMKEMQKIQPLMAELKAKYKDNKEKLNREMMTLMKTHKVNPLGGCLPMLIQIPIYFALYQALYMAIELRHAPFMLWIQDLSSKDPFYITPVLMGAAMFGQQKMTPTTADPAQAKMMMFMPLLFTFFMLWLPSGLVLYILVNSVLTIAQQWHINRTLKT